MNFTDNQIKDSVNRLISFIDKNKRLPNSVRVGKTNLTLKNYLETSQLKDAKKRAINFRDVKGRCANYVNICNVQVPKNIYIQLFSMACTTPKPKPTVKKYTQGNFAKREYIQEKSYHCLPNCEELGFDYLTGLQISEYIIANWAGTTSKGTSHEGANSSVAKFNKKYKKNLKITWKNFSDLGKTESERYEALGKLMEDKTKFVFCHIQYRFGEGNNGKGWGHYETPYQVIPSKKTIRVYNSLSGGYIEDRSYSKHTKYINAKNQKSICIISK